MISQEKLRQLMDHVSYTASQLPEKSEARKLLVDEFRMYQQTLRYLELGIDEKTISREHGELCHKKLVLQMRYKCNDDILNTLEDYKRINSRIKKLEWPVQESFLLTIRTASQDTAVILYGNYITVFPSGFPNAGNWSHSEMLWQEYLLMLVLTRHILSMQFSQRATLFLMLQMQSPIT